MPTYNTETGQFLGVKERLAFIMVRGDEDFLTDKIKKN